MSQLSILLVWLLLLLLLVLIFYLFLLLRNICFSFLTEFWMYQSVYCLCLLLNVSNVFDRFTNKTWAWLLLSRSIYGAMVKCLGCWIRDSVAFGLILLGGSKVESAFHSSEDDKMSTRNCPLSKVSPRNGFAALRKLNLIHK